MNPLSKMLGEDKEDSILSVGHIALDYIFDVEKLPEPNTSVQIPSVRRYYGGAACNVSVGVSKLGVKSGIISCVGRDFESSGYADYLKKLNIDLSRVYYSDEEETPKAWIFTDRDDNQITFFLWGAAKHYKELSAPKFDNKIIHLATGDPEYNLKCAKKGKECNSLVSFDPGQDLPQYSSETLNEIFDYTNILFTNKYEYERILKLLNIGLDDLRDKVDVLVITYGKDGSIIYTKNDSINIPSINVEHVVDPTGAGDSYRAGFLVGCLKGYSLEICGYLGSVVSSYVIEKIGCQVNMPSWDMVVSRLSDNGIEIK